MPLSLYAKNRQFLDYIDAAGEVLEEKTTCNLQILLSDHAEGIHRTLHKADMNNGGGIDLD